MRRPRLALAFLFFGFFAAASWAGPILVGRGAGEGEYSVVFARANLAQILEDCFQFSCALTPPEVQKYAVLSEKVKVTPELVLKNSDELGDDLFRIVNGEAWINQDLLWIDADKTVPYGVAEASALWLRVLAVDTAISGQELTDLIDRIKPPLRQQILRHGASLDNGGTFEILQWRQGHGVDRLFVRDPALQNLELTQALLAHFGCPHDLGALALYSPAWQTQTPLSPTRFLSTISLGAKWTCDGMTHFENAYISLEVEIDGNTPAQIDAQSITVTMGM